MPKILGINGSPRQDGNTAAMLQTVLDIGNTAGFGTELYQAGGREVRGCKACGSCFKNPGRCAIDDWVYEVYLKMKEADAILLGSPTYFSDLTPEIKCIIDRCGYLCRGEEFSLSRKIGAGVSAVRRSGGNHTLASIQHFFLINDFIVPGSYYWNMSLSLKRGDFAKDEEGVETIKRLGDNIVWLVEKTR